jgi:hypothetical protein
MNNFDKIKEVLINLSAINDMLTEFNTLPDTKFNITVMHHCSEDESQYGDCIILPSSLNECILSILNTYNTSLKRDLKSLITEEEDIQNNE